MKAKCYYYESSVIINSSQFLWSLVSDIDISLETAERWLLDAIYERTGVRATVDLIWVSTRKSCLENFMIVNYMNRSL
jgi:hypothetical protein